MPNYLDSTKIIARIGAKKAAELTADSGTVADAAKITEVLDEVEQAANSYLKKQVAVPVDAVAAPLTFLAVRGKVMDLVVYHLHLLRQPVPEDVRKAHDEAMAWFKAVAAGEIELPDSVQGGTVGDFGSNPKSAAELRDV